MLRLRRRLLTAFMVATLLVSAFPGISAGQTDTLTSGIVQSGLTYPWDLAFAPDGRMLVTERPGRLRVYASVRRGATLLATHTIPSVRAEGEAGLMGIAVDRNFATNSRIYMCASRRHVDPTLGEMWVNQVLRYTLSRDSQTLTFERHILPRTAMRAATIHNGCAVEHLSDGMIWISMGDANNPALAQDPNSYNGKILRATPDGGIPADNPVLSTGRRTHVYTLGHRNPQGIAQQPRTNYVYSVEHGPDRHDEINRLVPGSNYGWPCYTGSNEPYNMINGCRSAQYYRGAAWSSPSGTWALSNAAFASGSHWGRFSGYLFVTTLKQQDVRRFDADGYTVRYSATHFDALYGRMRGIALIPNGWLYATTSNGSNDRVVRIQYSP